MTSSLFNAEDVPPGEEALYKPLLPDRMIGRFVLPEETGRRVLYPYVNGTAVTAAQLEADFRVTWDRLSRSRATLSSRRSVEPGSSEWWRPTRPRPPQEMLVPKVVVPEVSLLPRFGLDVSGRWVVSHSPFVRARAEPMDEDSVARADGRVEFERRGVVHRLERQKVSATVTTRLEWRCFAVCRYPTCPAFPRLVSGALLKRWQEH